MFLFAHNYITVADVEMSDNAEESDDEIQSSENENESFDEQGNSEDSDANEVDGTGNSGWANTFANVLRQSKPKDKSYLVLSKAKKLADKKGAQEKSAKSFTFEIDQNFEVKPESSDDEKPTQDELEELALIANRKERNNKLLSLRVKPSVMDRERERTFKRIATKGLVQLFNAVRAQQRDLVDKLDQAGPLDHRRDAVLNNINKREFLNVLMGGARAKSENVDNPVKNEDVKEEVSAVAGRPSQWSVLRDDFMTNRKLSSHWNNEDEDDEDGDDNGEGSNGSASESFDEDLDED